MPHRQILSLLTLTCSMTLGAVQEVKAVEPDGIPPPEYSVIDSAGVELTSMFWQIKVADVSIGSAKSSLVHRTVSSSASEREIFLMGMKVDPYPRVEGVCNKFGYNLSVAVVGGQGGSEIFCIVGSQYLSPNETGATLVDNGNQTITYTNRRGTVWTLDKTIKHGVWQYAVTRMREPDGRVLSINYKTVTIYWPATNENKMFSRIQSVTRNDGFQLKYDHALNTDPTSTTIADWVAPVRVTAFNNAVDYCDPQADICTFSRSWPAATYSYTSTQTPFTYTFTITDQAGGVTKYTYTDNGMTLKFPASATQDARTYTYCGTLSTPPCPEGGSSRVSTAKINDKVWTYTKGSFVGDPYAPPHTIYASTASTGTSMMLHTIGGQKTDIQGEDQTTYHFDTSKPSNNLTSIERPEGDTTNYGYDSRSNVISVTRSPKSGSGLPTITIASAGYDATCANILTCNKPNWVKDALGNQTDYTYDTVHGGVLTATRPAVNGVRPQLRYTYTQRSAWIKNAGGAFVKSPDTIWLLSKESSCKTGAASGSGCAVASDEVVTTYDYGPDSGPNNLFLRGVSVAADDQTHRTCYAYDPTGNMISSTTPNAALGSCP